MVTKEKAWYEAGVALSGPQTAEECIIAAGLNWVVEKYPVMVRLPERGEAIGEGRGYFKLLENLFAVVRKDLLTPFGVVGAVYQPVQNTDAFRFFDEIVKDGRAMYTRAGLLGSGECVWLMAALPGFINVLDDKFSRTLLLMNRHDGNGSVRVFFAPTREISSSTMNLVVSTPDHRSKAKHSAAVVLHSSDIRRDFGKISSQFSELETLGNQMTRIFLTAKDADLMFKSVGLIPESADGESTRARNIVSEVFELFETGAGANLKATNGTLWGALNAIVSYVDFGRTTRETLTDEETTRTKSLLFGSGAKIKQKAWNYAIELLR